jgi:hypothetical protein
MELRIGIDASINATGFVMMLKEGNTIVETSYYLLTPKMKKYPEISESVEHLIYNRFWPSKKSTYSQTDIYKILSAENLVDVLVNKIKLKLLEIGSVEKISCRIEGSLMSASFNNGMARLNDLVAFGSVMRYCLIKSGLITEFKIIPPKTLKKLATGNGNAKKGQMITCHAEKFPESGLIYKGKIDDVVDAFWLAYVEEPKNFIDKEEFDFNNKNKYHAEHIIALYSERD